MADICDITGFGQFSVVDLTIERGEQLRPDQEARAEATGIWPAKRPFLEVCPGNGIYSELPSLIEGGLYDVSVATNRHGPRITFCGKGLKLTRVTGDYAVSLGVPRTRYRFEGQRFGDIFCV